MRKVWTALLAAVWLLQGCAGSGASQEAVDCETKLSAKSWRLVMFDNDPVTLTPPVTLRIAKGKVSGFDGCNRFFGKASVTPTAVTFGKLGSTRRFCRGKAGAMEKKVLGMLRDKKWWQFDARGRLVIFDDVHRLIFTAE